MDLESNYFVTQLFLRSRVRHHSHLGSFGCAKSVLGQYLFPTTHKTAYFRAASCVKVVLFKKNTYFLPSDTDYLSGSLDFQNQIQCIAWPKHIVHSGHICLVLAKREVAFVSFPVTALAEEEENNSYDTILCCRCERHIQIARR